MMAEPFAVGVLGSLIFPRAGSAVTRSNGLSRATRTNGQISLAANFFSPAPRRQKGSHKHKANPVVATIIGNVLYCQSWACPTSKEWLWHRDGPMRALLLEELEESKPTRSSTRGRRSSKSNRGRMRALAPQKDLGVRFSHKSYSTSSNACLASSPLMVQASTSQDSRDEQAAVAASPATDTLQECLKFLSSKNMSDNLLEYEEMLKKLPTSGVFLSAPFHDVLHFAELLADRIDEICAHRVYAPVINKWGEYLLGLQSTLGKTVASSSSPLDDDRMESLLHRAHAFNGNLSAVQQYLFEIVDKPDIPETLPQTCSDRILRSYILAVGAYRGEIPVLKYLVSRQRGLTNKPGADRLYFLLTDTKLGHFLSTVHNRHFNDIERVVTACQPPLPPAFQKQFMSEVCAGGRRKPFSNADGEWRSQQPPVVREGALHSSHSRLTKEQMDRSPDDGDGLSQDLERQLRSTQGPQGWDFTRPSANAIRHFEDMFPAGPGIRRAIEPPPRYYYILFEALSQGRPEVSNLQYFLQDAIYNGFTPTLFQFSTAIQACRSVNDKEGIFNIIRIMKEANLNGNPRIYTSLISFFAKILDVKTARAIREEAIKRGIVPDVVMNNAILYAYGRQGCYNEALQAFRTMQSTPNGVDTNSYNSMMKVALLNGSSLDTAMTFLSALRENGLAPNVFTYGTLIDAAISYDRLEIATKFYEELLDREKETGETWINVEILTSLLTGFIQAGLKGHSEDILTEMGRRGIKPNAVTYNALLRTYGSAKDEQQLQAAESLLSQLSKNGSGWDVLKNARQSPLALVYGPVLIGHVKRGDIDGAEATLDRYMSAGGTPTISHLTAMLTLYRDTDQVDKALMLWPIILEAAKQQSRLLEVGGAIINTQIAQITVALSVFTRLASKAGYHSEVTEAWNYLLKEGSTSLDEENWNDFIIACLRAGKVLRAFQVAERFLVPAFRDGRTNSMSVRSMGLPSEKTRRERLADLPDAPLMPRPVISVRQKRRRNLKARNLNYLVDDDLDSKLELLRVFNPLWRDKRPQHRVLAALGDSLTHLQEGYPLRAIQINEDASEDVIPSSVSDLDTTEELLAEIKQTCPATIAHLAGVENLYLRWDNKEIRRGRRGG